MKIKLYEKVSPFMVWFFIIVGIIIAGFTINSAINSFDLMQVVLFGIFSIAVFMIGIRNMRRMKKGELIETVYKCEKYEVVL